MQKWGGFSSATLTLGQFVRSLFFSAALHALALSLLAYAVFTDFEPPQPEPLLVASVVDEVPPVPIARLVVSDPHDEKGGNEMAGFGDGNGAALGAAAAQIAVSPQIALSEVDVSGRGQSQGFGVEGPFDDKLGKDVGERGASFFGLSASGMNFVFVVDLSGSMSEGNRMRRTVTELKRSIAHLAEDQRFYVIFFNHLAHPMPSETMLEASDVNQRKVQKWIGSMTPGGQTDPRWALQMALDLKPDSIFLMSDGEFQLDVMQDLHQDTGHIVPIHTIAFVSRAGEPVMREIASQTNGKFRFEP